MMAYLSDLAATAGSGTGSWGTGSSWGSHMMGGSFGGIGMSLFMLAFWVLAIVGVVVLVRWTWSGMGFAAQKEGSPETALGILQKRYARGEVDKQEYEARRSDLRS